MGKNKLEKFADMASYPHVFEYPYSAVDNVPFDMKGKWHQEFFKNDRRKTSLLLISKVPVCGPEQQRLCSRV